MESISSSCHSDHFDEKTASSRLTYTQLQEDLSALVKLRNPHIVQMIGALVDKKTIFVALEYMELGSLSSVLMDAAGIASGEGRHTIEKQWAVQVAQGLEYLHSVPPPLGPLLHTELRATNVLIDSSYNAKLTNFALESRVVRFARDQGYMLWMAPEVLNGERSTKESDIYSYLHGSVCLACALLSLFSCALTKHF